MWSQNCFIKVLKKVKNIKFMLQNSKRIGFLLLDNFSMIAFS
ncbi:GlxA family transcriptional regulator, partial [Acinetobacter baumannii]